jgi:hypothetical protein
MGEQKLNFKNFKQRGEWVEMLFMARAAREGLQVSKPYGGIRVLRLYRRKSFPVLTHSG